MVKVRPDGAFSVNALGLGREPFPLSFSLSEAPGRCVIHAAAAQASELADILAGAPIETIVVVNLETNSFLDENYQQWRPSRIAAEQGIGCTVHPFGALGKGVVGLSDEALVMRRDDLPGFLAGWSPYDLTLVGLADQPSAAQLDEMALTIGTADHSEAVLPALAGACLWYSGHDDCYVWMESTDRTVAVAVFRRLLALLAGSALASTTPVEVPSPAGTIVDDLIGRSYHWVGALGAAEQDAVTINLSATAEPWRLAQPSPGRVDCIAVYDMAGEAWRLAAPHQPR